MVIVVMVALVFLFTLVCAVLFFPEVMDRTVQGLNGVRCAAVAVLTRRRGKGPADLHDASVAGAVPTPLLAGPESRRTRRLMALLALIIVAVPSLSILLLRRNVVLDEFRGDDFAGSGSMIAQLLRGERLSPPAPPPPEVFTTEEVRRLRPEVITADRKWERINPDLQQRVLAIFEVMKRRYGYEMVLVEGYRSPERQAELMSGGKATRADAWQSCHQYGLAVDSAPLRDGKLQWDMSDAWTRRGYFLYGELARQAGLDWGGDWHSLKDYVHVEMGDSCRSAKNLRKAQS